VSVPNYEHETVENPGQYLPSKYNQFLGLRPLRDYYSQPANKKRSFPMKNIKFIKTPVFAFFPASKQITKIYFPALPLLRCHSGGQAGFLIVLVYPG
jgi:hypothetical protein